MHVIVTSMDVEWVDVCDYKVHLGLRREPGVETPVLEFSVRDKTTLARFHSEFDKSALVAAGFNAQDTAEQCLSVIGDAMDPTEDLVSISITAPLSQTHCPLCATPSKKKKKKLDTATDSDSDSDHLDLSLSVAKSDDKKDDIESEKKRIFCECEIAPLKIMITETVRKREYFYNLTVARVSHTQSSADAWKPASREEVTDLVDSVSRYKLQLAESKSQIAALEQSLRDSHSDLRSLQFLRSTTSAVSVSASASSAPPDLESPAQSVDSVSKARHKSDMDCISTELLSPAPSSGRAYAQPTVAGTGFLAHSLSTPIAAHRIKKKQLASKGLLKPRFSLGSAIGSGVVVGSDTRTALSSGLTAISSDYTIIEEQCSAASGGMPLAESRSVSLSHSLPSGDKQPLAMASTSGSGARVYASKSAVVSPRKCVIGNGAAVSRRRLMYFVSDEGSADGYYRLWRCKAECCTGLSPATEGLIAVVAANGRDIIVCENGLYRMEGVLTCGSGRVLNAYARIVINGAWAQQSLASATVGGHKASVALCHVQRLAAKDVIKVESPYAYGDSVFNRLYIEKLED